MYQKAGAWNALLVENPCSPFPCLLNISTAYKCRMISSKLFIGMVIFATMEETSSHFLLEHAGRQAASFLPSVYCLSMPRQLINWLCIGHSLSSLLVCFREWPRPVLLKKMSEDTLGLNLVVWDPRVSVWVVNYQLLKCFSISLCPSVGLKVLLCIVLGTCSIG